MSWGGEIEFHRVQDLAYDGGKFNTSPREGLKLVDLSTGALRKLGIKRIQLIDTTKFHYPATRRWAQSIYTQLPDAQGLRWISRQDGQAYAVILFGIRLKLLDFKLARTSGGLPLDGHSQASIIDLTIRIGVALVD